MPRLINKQINFLKRRRTYMAICAALVVLSCAILPLRGLSLSIDLGGGSAILLSDTGELTAQQLSDALSAARAGSPLIQSTADQRSGTQGFLVRLPISDLERTAQIAADISSSLGLSPSQVATAAISPSVSFTTIRQALIALAVALLLALILMAIRLEYKMGISALLSLCATVLTVVGIFSLIGLEFSLSVAVALAAVAAYALNDAVIVFMKVKDNRPNTEKHSYITVTNLSINQVFGRTLSTSIALLLPVIALAIFAGPALRMAALAFGLGLVIAPAMTIALACPVFALLKQREPKYQKVYERYGEEMDDFTPDEQLGR